MINSGRTKIEISDNLLCNFIGHRPHHGFFFHELEGAADLVSGYILCIIGKMSSFDTIIGHHRGRAKIEPTEKVLV